jgi:hypothetical protein
VPFVVRPVIHFAVTRLKLYLWRPSLHVSPRLVRKSAATVQQQSTAAAISTQRWPKGDERRTARTRPTRQRIPQAALRQVDNCFFADCVFVKAPHSGQSNNNVNWRPSDFMRCDERRQYRRLRFEGGRERRLANVRRTSDRLSVRRVCAVERTRQRRPPTELSQSQRDLNARAMGGMNGGILRQRQFPSTCPRMDLSPMIRIGIYDRMDYLRS